MDSERTSDAAGLVVDRVGSSPPRRATVPPETARRGASTPDVERLRRLRVPVIVRLAQRRMSLSALRSLSVGAIIEFEKGVDEPLELLINNQAIGRGECVKIGESFGLRILKIASPSLRVRSMGPSA